MLRSVLALLIAAHGVGHILFLVPLLGLANWGQASRSWLLTAETPARLIGSLLWITVIIAFGAAVFGLLGQQGWWRTAAIAAAVISSAGLILFWATPVRIPSGLCPGVQHPRAGRAGGASLAEPGRPGGMRVTSMGVLKRTDRVALSRSHWQRRSCWLLAVLPLIGLLLLTLLLLLSLIVNTVPAMLALSLQLLDAVVALGLFWLPHMLAALCLAVAAISLTALLAVALSRLLGDQRQTPEFEDTPAAQVAAIGGEEENG